MKKFLITFFIFFSAVLWAQDEEEKIFWNENYQLQWTDFKGKPAVGSPFAASTSSGITYSFSYGNSPQGIVDFKYEVESYFFPNKSWVKNPDSKEALLSHERLHFDISELHARILRHKLDNYTPGANAQNDMKNFYQEVNKLRDKMQNLFDKETNHGLKAEESLKWQQFVASELKKYEKYSS